MPRLHVFFVVLEDNLDEIMESSTQNRGAERCSSVRWSALDGIQAEDSRNVEVIGQLERGVRIDEGHPISCIALFAVDKRC